MTSKAQFIRQKELAAWWQSIANDARFDEVMVYAAATTLEAMPSAEQREGIIVFREILLTLSQPDAGPVSFAQPGLKHDLDPHRRTIKDQPAKSEKK